MTFKLEQKVKYRLPDNGIYIGKVVHLHQNGKVQVESRLSGEEYIVFDDDVMAFEPATVDVGPLLRYHARRSVLNGRLVPEGGLPKDWPEGVHEAALNLWSHVDSEHDEEVKLSMQGLDQNERQYVRYVMLQTRDPRHGYRSGRGEFTMHHFREPPARGRSVSSEPNVQQVPRQEGLYPPAQPPATVNSLYANIVGKGMTCGRVSSAPKQPFADVLGAGKKRSS